MPALGIYTWFAESVLGSSILLSFLLQSGVVIAEIAIGLALFGGFQEPGMAAAGVSRPRGSSGGGVSPVCSGGVLSVRVACWAWHIGSHSSKAQTAIIAN